MEHGVTKHLNYIAQLYIMFSITIFSDEIQKILMNYEECNFDTFEEKFSVCYFVEENIDN